MRPVCLPEPGEHFNAGFICTTAGWGRLSEGKSSCTTSLNQNPQNVLTDNEKPEFLIN